MINFKRNLEKYSIESKKLKKKFKKLTNFQSKFKNQVILKKNRKLILMNSENKSFIRLVEKELRKKPEFSFIIDLDKKNNEENEKEYKYKNFRIPRTFKMKTNISKNDEIWGKINFKNYNSQKIYKKYREIMNNRKEKIRRKKKFEMRNEKLIKKIEYKQTNLTFEAVDNNIYCICRQFYKEGDKMIGKFCFNFNINIFI